MRNAVAVGLAAMFAASAVRAAPAAATTDYTVLMSGHAAGALHLEVAAAGERCVDFDYNDRGRGPKTHSCITLDAAGLPASIVTTGVDYLKSPVEERFTSAGAAVQRGVLSKWSGPADQGASPRVAFYLASAGTSEDFAILARALLKAPEHAFDLLPAGHARIEKVAERTVEAAGARRTVALYFISGPAFTPAAIWLDADGELFLEGGSWMTSVRKGWEAVAPDLVKAQDAALSARAVEQAKALQRRPGRPLAITHAALYDAETRSVRRHTTVLVNGDRVEAVGPDGGVAIPPGSETVDAHGRTLMPGLFDMHVHFGGDSDGTLDLLNGVTTTRDLGNDMDELLARRARYESGELIGPRILLGGLIDGKGPLHGPIKVLVSTPEEAKAAVKTYGEHGYDQIKIYSSVPPELVPVIIAEAHARGMRVSGHIPAGMTMSQGVEAGYDEVQHANFWVLNFLGPEVNAKSNGMARFTEVGAHAKDIDLDGPEMKRFVALLQAHKTVVDPTLVAFEVMYLGAPRTTSPALAPVVDRLPPVVARGAAGGQLWKTDADRAAYAQSYAQLKRMLKLLYDSGIRIVPGTDGMAGFELAHELETYVSAGVPAKEALYMATLGSARVMRKDKDMGSIAPGKFADLILVDGDPTTNISDIRKVDWVMKGGTVYDPNALARSVGVKPRN